MQKMMMNETELATRWNISPKTLQRRRSEGRGPRFMKMSKRVVYPIDEILDYELVPSPHHPCTLTARISFNFCSRAKPDQVNSIFG